MSKVAHKIGEFERELLNPSTGGTYGGAVSEKEIIVEAGRTYIYLYLSCTRAPRAHPTTVLYVSNPRGVSVLSRR